MKRCSSWCIEAQLTVLTSWICQRILVGLNNDGIALFQTYAFYCQCEQRGEMTKKVDKNSQLFNLVKTRQVYEKIQNNLMKQHK